MVVSLATGCGRLDYAPLSDPDPAPDGGPELPPDGVNQRSLGTGGVLYQGDAAGPAGERRVTLEVPPAVGPGDRLRAGSREYFVVALEGDTLWLDADLSEAIDGPITIERAFPSLRSWMDARGGDLAGEERSEHALLYPDGIFPPNRVLLRADTSPEHHLEIRAAPGNDHGGQPGAGPVLDGTGIFIVINIEADHTVVSGLEIINAGEEPEGGGDASIRVEGVGVVLERLLIHDELSLSNGIRSAIAPFVTDTTVRNCMLWNLTDGIEMNAAAASLMRVENLTVQGTRYGLVQTGGTLIASNVISVDGTLENFRGEIQQQHNISSDDTATGPGSMTGIAADQLFVAPLGPDLHLLSDAPAVGAGIEPQSPDATDIDGQSRPQGAWDIGADER